MERGEVRSRISHGRKAALAAVLGVLCAAGPGWGAAQSTRKRPAAASRAAAVERGMDLAMAGHCREALPILRRELPRLKAKRSRRNAAMLIAQCGMSTNETGVVLEALAVLNREFPRDPKVLYTTTHYLSELANRKAGELVREEPESVEAQELIAESLVARGKQSEAEAEYRKILAKHPNVPGVHYQLGVMLLSKAPTAERLAEAKREMEAELRVNPGSPAAEYTLGEMAWRARKLDEAITHFSRATKLDAGLAEPYLGLGLALNAAGKYAAAIAPLAKYAAMNPDDPAGHYQLSIAYSRTGNKQKAAEQLVLLREATAKRKRQGRPASPGAGEPH